MERGLQVLLDSPDTPVSSIQIATLGDFEDSRYGSFSITRDDVEAWRQNLSELPGGRALIDLDHRADKKPRNSEAAGWITNIRWDEDKPMADVEWTPLGQEAIEQKRFMFFSPTYGPMDTENGGEIENVLQGGALTNKPFLRSMPALTLASDERIDAAVANLESDNDSRLLDVLTTKARNDLPDSAFALPGRKYPIHNLSHARNALARVEQDGTSAEQAEVRAKVYKKYPALKPSGKSMDVPSTDPSDPVSPPAAQSDSRPADMDTEVLKQLGLSEDTDVSEILDNIKKLQARAEMPRRSLEQRAHDNGKVLLDQDRYDEMIKDVARGARADEELKTQTFDIAFTRAVENGRAVPDQRDSFEKFYELDANHTLAMLNDGPRVVNTRPSGWDNELYQMSDAPPGVDEQSHSIDQKVKSRLRQLGKPMAEYQKVFEDMMAGGQV